MSKARFQKTPFHYFQYLALKIFCVLFSLLPYRLSIAVSRRLTGAVRFVMPNRFKRTVKDISLAFPEMSEDKARQTALESWRNMGAIMAEFIQLSRMSPENFKKHCKEVDGEIQKYANGWDISRLVKIDKDILRIAITELLYVKEAPLKVVVDEAVELAKKYSTDDSSSFVNGILAKVIVENGLK